MNSVRIIVYYAPVSKLAFREKIFAITYKIPDTRIVVYSVRWHTKKWKPMLSYIVPNLINANKKNLLEAQRVWKKVNKGNGPFFNFSLDGTIK